MKTSIEDFIKGIPKAELHLHIEGTLEPELMFELAKRNKIPLRFKSVAEVRRAYQFTNLQTFLDIYYEGAKVLIHEQDFYDLAKSYLDKAAAANVRRVELFFDPQTHTERGIAFKTVIEGLSRACKDAARQGVSAELILCFLRHLPEDMALKTLEEALPFQDKILAVGLDSSEVGHPPEKFKTVFEHARKAGLKAVAHAGEEGPPDYIWQALDLLKVSRIDHGVRCVEDKKLVERLVKEAVPLTVCPLSNVKLRVVKDLKQHNLKRLLDLGLRATVNSDDPAYFGGYVLDNLLASEQALDLGKEDIYRLERNAFEATFLSAAEKKKALDAVDRFYGDNK